MCFAILGKLMPILQMAMTESSWQSLLTKDPSKRMSLSFGTGSLRDTACSLDKLVWEPAAPTNWCWGLVYYYYVGWSTYSWTISRIFNEWSTFIRCRSPYLHNPPSWTLWLWAVTKRYGWTFRHRNNPVDGSVLQLWSHQIFLCEICNFRQSSQIWWWRKYSV